MESKEKTMRYSDDDLLCCPYVNCNGRARIIRPNGIGAFSVKCEECGFSTGEHLYEKWAVDSWNTRQEPTGQELVRIDEDVIKRKKPSLYGIWGNMKQRCSNKNNNRYEFYGGRGIVVCEKWQKYDGFKEDMEESFKTHCKKNANDTTIERIDNDGNYEPSNCRWATMQEQRKNTSMTRMYEYNGVTLCLKDWGRVFNIPSTTIWDNIVKYKKDFKEYIESKFGQPRHVEISKLQTKIQLLEIDLAEERAKNKNPVFGQPRQEWIENIVSILGEEKKLTSARHTDRVNEIIRQKNQLLSHLIDKVRELRETELNQPKTEGEE